MRSVTSALGPPLAFLFGGGLIPLLIGFLAESVSFAAGVLVAGIVMLLALPLLYYLRIGQFDAEAGC
jgi:NNP family nitrate/nitrite transporter-like MFS transporter